MSRGLPPGAPDPDREDTRAALVLVTGRDPLAAEIGWIGGHDVYVRAHARAACRAGFAPHLFAVAESPGERSTPLGTLHRTRSRPWPYKLWMAPAHVGPLSRAIERFAAERGLRRVLVHGFGVWGAGAVAAARRLERRGVHAVSVVSAYATYHFEARAKVAGLAAEHGLGERLQYRLLDLLARHVVDPCERRACTEAALVLVNYDAVAGLLREAYGDAVRSRKIPYTSESAFLAAAGSGGAAAQPESVGALRPAGAPLILSVGRHDPRKGMDVLLRALGRLRAQGVPFRGCLVGGGPLLQAHRRLAARLGLTGQVAIDGFVADPAVYRRHADLFVLPSLREGSGSLSLVEALEAGLPVVTSSCDGIPEDVDEGRGALLVPPGDAGALAAALARLLADRTLRESLGRGAREVHARRFSAAGLVDALRTVYAELGFVP